jgi:23S rRNA (guanosine2251-2'-O)-methyltransferase
MTATSYEIRLCQNCGLRYPLTEGHPFGKRCPSCLGETQAVLKRTISPFPSKKDRSGIRSEIRMSALLDNIRSAWNVGSIFRTADGLGVERLHLCGITPTPENESVTKTSLGAEETVAWEYSRNALETANQLKAEGYTLIALEQDERAFPISNLLPERSDQKGAQSHRLVREKGEPSQIESKGLEDITQPDPSTTGFAIASPSVQGESKVIILGNEVTGVDPELLELCDSIIHIPMKGKKRSLNVEVAFGIAAYVLLNTRTVD